MEFLLIQFYVTAELWPPGFGRFSWVYILRVRLKEKKNKKTTKNTRSFILFISCHFRIQLFLCTMERRRIIFSLCFILFIADLSVALFNCLCAGNYSESETIPSTAALIWITDALSSFEKKQKGKKGDSHTHVSLEKSLVDTTNH